MHFFTASYIFCQTDQLRQTSLNVSLVKIFNIKLLIHTGQYLPYMSVNFFFNQALYYNYQLFPVDLDSIEGGTTSPT